MLKIRLQRVGRKHEPTFRLVLTDSKNSTKSGKSLEILGSFDARKHDSAVFKAERISHWIAEGAKPTDTVHNLLISKKIITGKKINVLPLKKAIVKDAPEVKAEEKKETPAEVKEETPVETSAEPTPAETVEVEAVS